MDPNIDVSNIKSWTVDQLKLELRKRNLSVKGRKAEIRRRLLNAIGRNGDIEKNKEEKTTQLKEFSNCREYIDKLEFDLFIQDFVAFKEHVFTNLSNINETIDSNFKSDELSILQNENKFLKQELNNKQAIINILSEDLKKNESEKQQHYNDINITNKSWQSPRNPISKIQKSSLIHPIKSTNKYELLEIEPTNEIQITKEIKLPRYSNKRSVSKKANDNIKINGFPIDQRPERNVRQFANDTEKTKPGNSSYADIVSKGKKITIFGDSIIKRIKGRELGKHVLHGNTFIKSFPGAKAKAINHYVVPTLIDENPDAVVIHAGTNNIRTRRGYSEETNESIAHEIINIGKTCRQVGGVNYIFISAITCRSNLEETKKVREINDFLSSLCEREGFVFIDNNSIKREHLWKDGLHLLDEGTTILANNIINSLNENLL